MSKDIKYKKRNLIVIHKPIDVYLYVLYSSKGKEKGRIFMKESYVLTKSALIVKISGELDQHSAIGLRKSLDKKILEGCDNLIFDLSSLEFMDSSGIGVIIGRYKNVCAMGGFTAIASAKPSVERIIRLAAIDKIIPLYKSVDDAITGINNTQKKGL